MEVKLLHLQTHIRAEGGEGGGAKRRLNAKARADRWNQIQSKEGRDKGQKVEKIRVCLSLCVCICVCLRVCVAGSSVATLTALGKQQQLVKSNTPVGGIFSLLKAEVISIGESGCCITGVPCKDISRCQAGV